MILYICIPRFLPASEFLLVEALELRRVDAAVLPLVPFLRIRV